MGDNDDLMIEVTGSSDKASTALDKVIAKVTQMQEAIEKVTPSLSKFTEKLDSITAGSKAFAMLDKLTKGTGNLSAASKKAESNEAMYQARLDRANVSMARSQAQAEKLAAARQKLAEISAIDAHNQAAFSMSPEDFKKNFDHSGTESPVETVIPEVPETATQNVSSMKYNMAEIQAQIDSITSGIGKKGPKINIDTDAATAEIRKIGEYIDSLTPKVSAMSSATQAQFNAIAAKLNLVSQKIDNQRMLYRSLADQAARVAQEQGEGSTAYLQMEKRMLTADSAAQRLSETQEKLKAELADVTSATGKVGTGMTDAGSKSEKAAKRSTSAWSNTMRMFEKMLIRIAAFRVFSAISQGIVTGIQDMALAGGQANATMSALATNSLYLKNSIGAALMPVLQALVPVLNQITDALANVFNTIAMLIARIFNHSSTVTIAQRANVNYAQAVGGIGDKAKDTTAKVKELQRTVMGFDELNVLNKPTTTTPKATAPSSGKAGMPSYGSMFKTVKVPEWVNKVGSWTDKIQAFIKSNINSITRLLRMAPLVIGAVLAFSGTNIPLGIALMAVGAVEMAKQGKEDWDYLSSKTASSLDKTKRALAITGAVELAIGAILAFSGVSVGLGIALMAGGITTTAATLDWDSISPKVKQSLGAITFTSAVSMLALGAIFTATGHLPLGIGLLIAGATSMWASASLNWSTMDGKLKSKVAMWTAIASGALLAIGTILVCTGHIPLGVGMIIAGAAGLVSAVALNWGAITGKVKSILDAIVGFFKGAWSKIEGIWKGAGSWFNGIFDKIKGAFKPNMISDKMGDAWQWVKDKWNGAGRWFGGIWDSIISKFKPNMISDGFKHAWDSLTSWHIPTPHISWGSGGWQADGWIYNVLHTLHLPTQLPTLDVNWYANGGLFTAPTIVGMGEAGPEAALPLNDGTFSQIAKGIQQNQSPDSQEAIISRMDDISKRLQSLETAILDRPVNLYTTDRKIAESSNRGNASIDRCYHPIAQT